MSSDELNQSTRRDFLARVAKTGALVAPVIATFALTSGSPAQARRTMLGAQGNQPEPSGFGNEDYLEELKKRIGSDLPDTK